MKEYKCDTCGRREITDNINPPKCYCGLPKFITLMEDMKEEYQQILIPCILLNVDDRFYL